jgi:hypothetical protein
MPRGIKKQTITTSEYKAEPLKPAGKRGRHLTRYELETVINFNQEEEMGYIFTYEPTWQRHIEQRLKIQPYLVNDSGGKSYRIPKHSISKPRVPKNLTAEQRKAIGERLGKRKATI